jgi:peptide deformylase
MKILLYPHFRLSRPNQPLQQYTSKEKEKVAEMIDLMYKYDGVGLAAPQVGWNVQLFVMNTGKKGEEGIYINPKIVTSGDMIGVGEGCLSFPGLWATIKRFTNVQMTAEIPNRSIVQNFEGLQAQAIQHEIDHLEGMLIIERMTPADLRKNTLLLKRLKNIRQE